MSLAYSFTSCFSLERRSLKISCSLMLGRELNVLFMRGSSFLAMAAQIVVQRVEMLLVVLRCAVGYVFKRLIAEPFGAYAALFISKRFVVHLVLDYAQVFRVHPRALCLGIAVLVKGHVFSS